jgi:hypothetical protein
VIKKFDTGFLLSGTSLHFINTRVSIGETVIARIAAPISENVFVRTRGENNFFSWPVRKRIGANEIIMIITEKKTDRPTVLEDSSIIATLSSSGISLV